MRHSFVDGFCRYTHTHTQMDVFWFLQRKVVIAVRPISVLVSINLWRNYNVIKEFHSFKFLEDKVYVGGFSVDFNPR